MSVGKLDKDGYPILYSNQMGIEVSLGEDNEIPYFKASLNLIKSVSRYLKDSDSVLLWEDLSANAEGYRFGLSSALFTKEYGISEKRYYKAKNNLIAKGFLVANESKRNWYYFRKSPSELSDFISMRLVQKGESDSAEIGESLIQKGGVALAQKGESSFPAIEKEQDENVRLVQKGGVTHTKRGSDSYKKEESLIPKVGRNIINNINNIDMIGISLSDEERQKIMDKEFAEDGMISWTGRELVDSVRNKGVNLDYVVKMYPEVEEYRDVIEFLANEEQA